MDLLGRKINSDQVSRHPDHSFKFVFPDGESYRIRVKDVFNNKEIDIKSTWELSPFQYAPEFAHSIGVREPTFFMSVGEKWFS